MDQVHVVRHKVLVEGLSARRVAREMGVSRNTVKRYLSQAAPTRVERQARGRPVALAVDGKGALLIADDTGNSVWRVSAASP